MSICLFIINKIFKAKVVSCLKCVPFVDFLNRCWGISIFTVVSDALNRNTFPLGINMCLISNKFGHCERVITLIK